MGARLCEYPCTELSDFLDCDKESDNVAEKLEDVVSFGKGWKFCDAESGDWKTAAEKALTVDVLW